MRLELQRSGGFTGTRVRWRVDAPDDAAWRDLVDRAGLRFRTPWLRIGQVVLGNPFGGGTAHQDYAFTLSVDGRRAFFRGIDVTGPLAELVDRITREGEEIGSR
jgi:hypothetical protein